MGNCCSQTKKSPQSSSAPHKTQNVKRQSQQNGTQQPSGAPLVKHFIVLIHGNNGFPAQMFAMRDALAKKFASSGIDVFVPQSNSKDTHHGVKVGAQRIAEEMKQHIEHQQSKENVRYADKMQFSVISHSLGGLYARYFIRELMVTNVDLWNRFIPTSFMTCNSPHLGSRIPVTDFTSWVKATGADIYSDLIGQTGKDLFLKNDLLLKMSEPDSDFIQALKAFPHRTVTGVSQGDFVVSLASAVCRQSVPYPRAPNLRSFVDDAIFPNPMEVLAFSAFDDSYLPIFERFSSKFKSTKGEVPEYIPKESEWDIDEVHETSFRPQMLVNLNKVGFRRIEFQFHVFHERFVLNGSLHGMALSIVGKLGDLHIMEMSERENSGPLSVDFLSDILSKDHGVDAESGDLLVTKQS